FFQKSANHVGVSWLIGAGIEILLSPGVGTSARDLALEMGQGAGAARVVGLQKMVGTGCAVLVAEDIAEAGHLVGVISHDERVVRQRQAHVGFHVETITQKDYFGPPEVYRFADAPGEGLAREVLARARNAEHGKGQGARVDGAALPRRGV